MLLNFKCDIIQTEFASVRNAFGHLAILFFSLIAIDGIYCIEMIARCKKNFYLTRSRQNAFLIQCGNSRTEVFF